LKEVAYVYALDGVTDYQQVLLDPGKHLKSGKEFKRSSTLVQDFELANSNPVRVACVKTPVENWWPSLIHQPALDRILSFSGHPTKKKAV